MDSSKEEGKGFFDFSTLFCYPFCSLFSFSLCPFQVVFLCAVQGKKGACIENAVVVVTLV